MTVPRWLISRSASCGRKPWPAVIGPFESKAILYNGSDHGGSAGMRNRPHRQLEPITARSRPALEFGVPAESGCPATSISPSRYRPCLWRPPGPLGRASLPVLAAQDVFWAEEEALLPAKFSPSMLAEFGTQWCLVGHSERRIHAGRDGRDGREKSGAL